MDTRYFYQLNRTLKNQERAIPRLIIDLDRLDWNIEILRPSLRPDLDFRIVVQSLPSSRKGPGIWPTGMVRSLMNAAPL